MSIDEKIGKYNPCDPRSGDLGDKIHSLFAWMYDDTDCACCTYIRGLVIGILLGTVPIAGLVVLTILFLWKKSR